MRFTVAGTVPVSHRIPFYAAQEMLLHHQTGCKSTKFPDIQNNVPEAYEKNIERGILCSVFLFATKKTFILHHEKKATAYRERIIFF